LKNSIVVTVKLYKEILMSQPKLPAVKKTRKWQFLSMLVALFVAATLMFGLVGRAALADNPPDPNQQHQAQPGDQTDEDGFTVNEGFTADEKAELQKLLAGSLTPEQTTQIKAFAAEKIRQYVPIAIDRLEKKTQKTADTRLFWVFLVIVLGIPLLALVGFLLYPLIMRKKIAKNIPGGVKLGEIYKLYAPQAFMVALILLLLGSALWGIQFLNGRLLGGITNPQVVLQREALNDLVDKSDHLVDEYTTMFVSLAYDLDTADPDKAAFDLILDNATKLKDDPIINFTSSVVQFVMPFLNYISLVTFLIVLALFILRITPDMLRLLTYPIDILTAEKTGKPLPEFESRAAGVIGAEKSAGMTMRQIGRKLMWTEMKVIAVFAVAILVVAALMSLALIFFFQPIAGMLMETVNAGLANFLNVEGSSSLVSTTLLFMMLFIVECVVITLVTFVFILMRVQDVIRQRFAGNITWPQVGMYMRKTGLRFGWLLAVIVVLGAGLPYLVDFSVDKMVVKGQEPNWTLILLLIPIILLVGFNFLFWLLRGYKMLISLFKNSATKEFDLPKPGAKKPIAVG